MQRKRNPHTLLLGLQTGATTMENSMEILKKLKIEIPYDSAILLLGIYPKNMKSTIQRDLRIPMFIAALFTIAKMWKQPTCPSMDERIKKMWHIYTMEYYLAIKKTKSSHLQQHGWTWRVLR